MNLHNIDEKMKPSELLDSYILWSSIYIDFSKVGSIEMQEGLSIIQELRDELKRYSEMEKDIKLYFETMYSDKKPNERRNSKFF